MAVNVGNMKWLFHALRVFTTKFSEQIYILGNFEQGPELSASKSFDLFFLCSLICCCNLHKLFLLDLQTPFWFATLVVNLEGLFWSCENFVLPSEWLTICFGMRFRACPLRGVANFAVSDFVCCEIDCARLV